MPGTRAGGSITRPSRRGLAFAALGLVLAVAVGVIWWRAAAKPTAAPVAVPERVCGGSVSRAPLVRLLPEHGDPYQEYLGPGPAQTHVSTWCRVRGGGATVQFFYVRETPEGFKEQLAKYPKRKENAPLGWGKVKGWGNDTSAHLYVDCPNEELGLIQQVHIQVGYSKPYGHPVENQRALLGQLVADGARYVAKGLTCKGADELPTEPATFG
ncbi:hypothetical protein OG357_27855 [Streptomyces sp. NBC_01255]|uniref:hypothetical protein n=1 Tax=Streptomyces sp. NBC_01255 TaxID=2903798 RepID=UPI002E3415E9|nr:hypothetical protein [Streptomyces sp. NBC_01255]